MGIARYSFLKDSIEIDTARFNLSLSDHTEIETAMY
jgi:hypothetical protein